jgi:hypothetical protein
MLSFFLALISSLLLIARSTHALVLLAKTSETFKLAELQYAEAYLQAQAQDYTASRLLVDRSTGSTLLELEGVPVSILDPAASTDSNLFPSSLRRCDWILEVFHKADTAEKLIEHLREESSGDTKIRDGWTLDYVRFEGAALKDDPKGSPIRYEQTYSMKTLLASVAQALPTVPTLDPQLCTEKLLLVDAKSKSGNGVFLGRLCHSTSDAKSSSSYLLSSRWAQRPFQYSSAINQKAAEIIMDYLRGAIPSYNNMSDDCSPPLLLDPTCGSGTFLALAMEQGFRVEGYDVNSSCSDGAWRNIVHMFGEEQARARASVHCLDSSQSRNSDKLENPACVVSNLPWGVNSVDYIDENYRILRSIHVRLSSDTPCVFVTKSEESKMFQETGYEILAQAHIPPRDFTLPRSKKKKDLEDGDARNGRNSCVVTIARSQ